MIRAYLDAVLAITAELAPWLFLGAAVAGALHVLVPAGWIRRHLGGRGVWAATKAALVGVPMPLCSCSVIPTGLGLHREGAGRGATLSFLIATPQTGVDSIAVTAAFLGWPFAIFKMLAALAMGVIGGSLGDAAAPKPMATEEPAPSCCAVDGAPASRWRRAWTFAVDDLLRSIWRWLALGILISAGIGLIATPDSLSFAGMGGGLTAMAVALAVSVPLYVCATASVPIAAALVAAGLPTGAALVFLMAGPATNVATIGAVARELGWRSAGIYLATIVVGSVGLGLAFDAIFGLRAATVSTPLHHHHEGSWIGWIGAAALAVLLLRFALADLRALAARGRRPASCCASEAPAPEPKSCCTPAARKPSPAGASRQSEHADHPH